MSKIDVFDPALCCGTGVCAAEVDQDLVDFSALVQWARTRGVRIERHHLAQQPLDFAANPVVAELLRANGSKVLPVTVVDGRPVLTGRYPNRAELAGLAGLISTPWIPLNVVAGDVCAPGCCDSC